MPNLTDKDKEEIRAAWELPEEEIEKELLIVLLQKRAAMAESAAVGEIVLIPKWRGLWLRLFWWIWTKEQRIRFLFKPVLRSLIKEYSNQIQGVICVEFKYCEKRNRQEYREAGYKLATEIAERLQGAGLGISLPMTWLSVYLLRTAMLNRVCKC